MEFLNMLIQKVLFLLLMFEITIDGMVVSNSFNLDNFRKVNGESDKSHEKVSDYLYNHNYDGEYEDYWQPVVVDLDTYDLYYENDDIVTEKDAINYQNEIEFASRPIARQFNDLCPDIPENVKQDLCHVKICQVDKDCQQVEDSAKKYKTHKQDYACCFNGCVTTCLPKVDLPKAFDWIEDTDLKSGRPKNMKQKDLKSLQPANGDSKDGKLTLPGGCLITFQQLEDIRLFKKYNHVESCTCLDGEIKCQIAL